VHSTLPEDLEADFIFIRTTGLPKGVQISHHSVIANAVQTDFVMSLDPELSTHEQSAAHSKWLCCLPLYHGLGLCYYFHISVFRRVPTYIMKNYDTDQFLSHIQRYKITELHLVPPMIVAMVKHPGLQKGLFDISTVNKTFSCAAPLGAQITLQYESLWPKGHMNVKQGLASSE
jgi:4-coumarate--CoA ligase